MTSSGSKIELSSDILLERMMKLHPKLIDLTLDRVWRILGALEHPEKRLAPVIHLAGTNGKGSTLAMIRAGLEAGGARVHAYISPHLARFHERIYLAGNLISEQALSDILARCESANNHAKITYFEITTAAAFVAFSETPADYCLLETGLGGRLDATNVVARPALSIITPISLDHQQYLGETLAEIAYEKAGIIKPNVPCIVGKQPAQAQEVITAQARKLGADLYRYGHEWHIEETPKGLCYKDMCGEIALPRPALLGRHQVENAGMAVAALRALNKENNSANALTGAQWPARMQRLTSGAFADADNYPELWLECGHNSAAGYAIAQTLKELPPKPLVVITGMLNTKDNRAFLAPLAESANAILTLTIPSTDASLAAEELAKIARTLLKEVRVMPDIASAIKTAYEIAPTGRILITGSLYLAGHVMQLLAKKPDFIKKIIASKR